MTTRNFAIGFALIATLMVSTVARAQKQKTVVAVPARAGAVEGKTENSDAFIWRLFTEFAVPASKGSPSPVVFETWASDADTFSAKPYWPKVGEPIKLQASVLEFAKILGASASVIELRARTAPPSNSSSPFPSEEV